MPHVKDLAYLQTLALTGSITKTAELHGLSVPAVSKAMRLLEEQVDARLFIRGARSIALTEEGELLAERASLIHHTWESTLNELQNSREEPRGRVRVSISETYG